ncbi:hypothetical protein [Kribbella sp. C-35]|uniref:WXG100-like domain-containing protein n=1 Tax=Kribbella sp. C-35 TaxID=2789276 RepID=UPI00397DACE4
MIPEPSGPLWDWLQKLVDSTQIFPNVDEDAADRMGAGWKTLEKAMADTIAAAQAGNDRMPAVWGDQNGQLYHENLKQALGNEGYGLAIDSFEQMSALCTKFATDVRQTKNQIWSELIMNAFFFALTFLLPPGIGDLFRWRLAAMLIERFSGLIRAAAELTHAAAGGLGARALSLAGHTAWEGVEEVLTELIAQQLDIRDGTRKNIDWTQVGISGLAGVLGSPMSMGLNAGGKGLRRLVGLPDGTRLERRIPYILQGSGNAFVTNSITSPISSELAKYLVTGQAPEFGRALAEGWFQAGVLGASRVHSVHAGDAMGQSFFNGVREARGIAPYVDAHGGPPHTPTSQSAQDPGNTTQSPAAASNPSGGTTAAAGSTAGAGSSVGTGSGSSSGGSASGGTSTGNSGGSSSQDAHVDRHVQPNRTAPSDQQHDDQQQNQQHQDQQHQDEQVADQQAPNDQGAPGLADATTQHAGDTSAPRGPAGPGDSHNAANDVSPGTTDSGNHPVQSEHAQPHAEQPGAPAAVNTGQDVGGSVAPVAGGTAAPAATQVTGAGSHLAGQGPAPTAVGQQSSSPTAPPSTIPAVVQKADPAEATGPVAQSNIATAPQNDVPRKPGAGAATEESGMTPDATGEQSDAAPAADVDVDSNVVTPGGAAMAGEAQAQAAAVTADATEESNDAPKPLPAHTTSERSGQSNGPAADTETAEDPSEVLAQEGDNIVRRTDARDGKPAEVRIEFRGANQHGTPSAKRTNPFSWVAGKVRHRDIVPSGTQFQMWAFHTMQQQLAALARAGHSFDLAFRAVQNAETGIMELHAEITLFRADGEVVHVAQTNLAEAATAVKRGDFGSGHPPVPRTAPGDLEVGESAMFRPRVIDVRSAIPDNLVANPETLDTLHERLALLEKAGLDVRVEVTRVPRPHTKVDGVRLTVEVSHPKGKHTFGPSTPEDLVQTPDRTAHVEEVTGVEEAQVDSDGQPVGRRLFRTEDPETSPEDFSRVDPDAYSVLRDHADALVQSGHKVSLQAVRDGVLLEVTSPDGTTERITGTAWDVLDQVSPIPAVVVDAEAVAAAGSVEAAAHQELMARLNERAADGSLTAAAGRMRKAHYQVGPDSKPRRGILSRRAGRTEAAPDRTFQVRFGEQELSVRLPWVEQRPHRTIQDRNLRPTVIELAQVVDGHRIGRTQVEFSDPVLDLSEKVLDSLASTLNAWQDGGPALGPEQLGDDFARTIEGWLAARHSGDRVFRVYLEVAGRGTFDQLYVRLSADGTVTGFAVVEAKGPNADLGAAQGIDETTRYAQGHWEYVRSLLAGLSDPERQDRVGVLMSEIVVVQQSAEEYAGRYATRTVSETENYIDELRNAYAERVAAEAVADQQDAHRAAQGAAKKAAKDAGLSVKDQKKAGTVAHAQAREATRQAAYAKAVAEFAQGDVDWEVQAWADRAEQLTKQELAEQKRVEANPRPQEPNPAWETYVNLSREAGKARVVANWAAEHVETVREFLADPDAARRAWHDAAYAVAYEAASEEGGGPLTKAPARPEIQNPFSDSAQLAAALQPFLDDGSLEYFVVRALVADETGARTPHGIEITEYSMDPDGATEPASPGVPEHTAVADQDLLRAAEHEHEHEHLDPGGRRINQDAVDNGRGLERTAETVEEVATAVGVDLTGIEVVILSETTEYAYLDDRRAMASVVQFADGTVRVELGPASFADRKTLAATLAHERTHVDQFRDGRVTGANTPEMEQEAHASEAPALERLQAHDQIHDRSDVRPAEPTRHRDPRNDPQRGGPGRHGPPDRGNEPGREDPGRGTHLYRGVEDHPDGPDDRPRAHADAAAGDGSRQPDLTLTFRGVRVGVFPAETQVPWQELVRLQEAVEAAVRRGLEVELTFAMDPQTKWLEATAHVTDPHTGETVTYRRATIADLTNRLRPLVARTANPTPNPQPTPPSQLNPASQPNPASRPNRSSVEAPATQNPPTEAPRRSPRVEKPRGDRFLPGWLLVGVEAARAIMLPEVHRAAEVREIVHVDADRYQVTTVGGRTFVLQVRVGPLEPTTVAHYLAVPGLTPTADVTLSDRLALTEVPQVLARVLAETVAATLNPTPAQLAGTDETPVLRPDSDPELDPLLKAEDHGTLAEGRLLAAEFDATASASQRRHIRGLMAALVASMSLGKQQPNSDLLHTMITEDDSALAQRFEDRRSLKDDRLPVKAYVVKSLRSSVLSAVLIGSSAYLATGSIVTGVALSVPTIVNSLVGALTERWLDGRKETGRQPAYDADRAMRDREYPGMKGLLDGAPEQAPDQVAKAPRATKQVHYLVRHAVPLLAATGTAAALTAAGIPAMSAIVAIGLSAVAKSLAERLVDIKKLDFRLGRVDATVRNQLADPTALQNQLVAILQDYRSQLETLRGHLTGTARNAIQPTGELATAESPGTPGFGVHAAAQAIDNVTAAARRLISHLAATQSQDPAKPVVDNDPTELAKHLNLFAEGLVNAVGPAITSLLLGAVGDKIFVNLEEKAGDAQKNWDHAQREAVRSQALLDALADQVQQVDEAIRQLRELVAVHRPGVDLSDRTADRASFPAAPELPEGARPPGQSKYWVYLQQVAFAAIGAAGGVLVLDQIFDLDTVSVVITVAGAVGGVTGTPVARLLFRRAELERKEANATDLAKQAVDRRQLTRQAAIGKYLMAQLLDQIQQMRELLVTSGRPVAEVRPGDPEYTDRVRAATERAYLDNLTPGPAATDLDARAQRIEALERIDRMAAALDWADSSQADVAEARSRLVHAIALYEGIADQSGARKTFPDLAQASPERGRRVTGGPTDQVRAGAGRALGRMLGEPAGKPLLEDRLVALEEIVRAAGAVDAHTAAGTPESLAYVQQQLTDHIAAYNELLQQAALPGTFPRPAISPDDPPDTGPATPPAPPDPLTTPPGPVVLGQVGDSVQIAVTEGGLAQSLPEALISEPLALAALEARWVELVRGGYQVNVTVTKVAGRHATVDSLELTVEVTDPHSTVPAEARNVYGPADVRTLVEQMITNQQSPGGRHRQPDAAPTEDGASSYLTPAAFDPAGGAVSGQVASNESANRATWSFGTPGQADEVVLELREVHRPEALVNPNGKPEALPRIPLDWAFARDRARGLIPPGAAISRQEFAALEQRIQQLIADGHAVSVRLRVLNGQLIVDAYVRDAATRRSAVHEDLSLAELVVALDNQVLVTPARAAEVAVHAAVANLGAIHLQDGSVRVTTTDGRQVVIPAETLARITAELGQSGATQDALNAEAVRRVAGHLGQPETRPARRSAADVLRAAAHRVSADEIIRRDRELTGNPAPTAHDQNPAGEGGSGRQTHAPEVKDTRFIANGRAAAEGPLTVDRVIAAINGVLGSDLGALSVGDPAVVGQLVVVATQHFSVRVGRVRRGKVAATEVRAGTALDPHVVTFATGVSDSQLARVWVHELSHTLQELRAPEGGPVRRLWSRLTGTGPNACVDAQFNEFRYLQRQWARGDSPELRQDIEGLVNAIRKRGHVPPTLPWNSPIPLDPRAELKAAITRQLTGIDETIASLNALIASKQAAAKKAIEAAGKEAEKRDQVAKDNGAAARRRAAEAEERKQTELAAWHNQIATDYQRALAKLTAARAGYAQLLQNVATATPRHLVAEAHKFAAEVAAYQTALEGLAPPTAALPSMQPTGRLPHLTALTDRINATLAANRIDHTFTADELQDLLSAEFGRILTDDGVVLRVGTNHPADLRINLSVDELIEVRDPKLKASEIINGLFPQGGRRVATAATSRLGTTFTVPMKALLQLLGRLIHQPWLGDLTLKGEIGTERTRTVTGNAAEYSQTGAVEDIRGESVLYTGKASWQLDVRIDRTWSAAETVAEGNAVDATELRAWVSHAYTVDAAKDTDQRLDLANGRMPAHLLTSVTGLEELTDKVVADNEGRLAELGSDRTQVEEQLHAILNNDLPSRLAESTDHAVLRPLTVDGKPVGHVEITTRIRYEKVELVGAQSTTHWQESVRIGFSTTSTQQSFGASASGSLKAGYDGEAVHDIDPDGTDVGPTVSGGRTATRSEALSGGGTSIHVGVHRFTGPTQAYSMELEHVVKVVLDGEPATTPGDSAVVARVRVKDAYRYGLPVDRSAVHSGGQTVDGEVDPNAVVPGRKLEFPAWAKDAAGRLNTAGPWNVQAVTGGKAAFKAIMARLAGRGFVPPLDGNGNPDLSKLSTDPIERNAQLLNLEELREQLSTERLEAGYDIAAQDGILITLTHARTAQATENVVLRIRIEPHASKPLGVTNDEAVVLLNIGSETAGRSASRSKVWPWRADPLSTSSTTGLDGKAALSYGRQALGRVLAWFTGGTINQVTLIESTSPVAVFDVRHTLSVSEGAETFYTSSPDETAHILIDSDLLPYDDALPPTPPTGPMRPSVLQRMTLLALGATEFTAKLPKAIRDEATALQQLGAFLNPRNLLSHPEWTGTGYSTTLLVPGFGGFSRRIAVSLTGRLQNAQLVAVTDGVSGDINLALGSHGSATGRSYGGSTQASFGASENSVGGGVNASLGTSGSTSRTDQDIWGVERLTIETGRHYVFTAAAEVSFAVGNHQPAELSVGTVFQLAEREALRFYAQNELALPLQQVADAVERFLHGHLKLDRRAATGLVRRYRADLAAARRSGTPVPALSAEHTAQVLVAKLRPSPRPHPGTPEQRLAEILRDQPPPRIDLPEHYREHLGFSLIESTEFDANHELLAEVYDVLRSEFGVDPAEDPALAEALFVDLAGKRWWGRLEDMLGRSGFTRSYPVGRPGQLSAEQVTLRIRAEFADAAEKLGEAKDVVGIVQRYLYGDRSRSRSSGRSSGVGADGSADPTRSWSASTDPSGGTSAAAGDQVTRLERIAGFDGMTRVGRRMRLRIEVEHDAAAPTRSPLGQRLSPRLPVVPKVRNLTGTIVQLIPTAAVGRKVPSVPVVPGEVQLPSMYHVEGVGAVDGRADLFDVVVDALADKEWLGVDGVRAHLAELENKLSASARNAQFSRMASAEGFTLAPLEVPGTKQDTVEVTIRARVSTVDVVSAPFAGELGEVNRHQETASTTTTMGRMLPVTASGTYAIGSASTGDQVSDATTDLRGARTERSHFEKGNLVTVRVRVAYDLTITRTHHTPTGATRQRSITHHPSATQGHAYLTLHQSDHQSLTPTTPPAPPTPPPPPTPPTPPTRPNAPMPPTAPMPPDPRPAPMPTVPMPPDPPTAPIVPTPPARLTAPIPPAPGPRPAGVVSSRWKPIHTGASAEDQRRAE